MGEPVEGMIGYGAGVEVSINSGPYVDFDGLYELVLPPLTITNPESPQMNLPDNTMMRIAGKVKKYGQATFGLVWIPGSAAEVLVDSLADLGTSFSVRATLPNGATWVFAGLLASKTPTTPWDDRMTCAVVMDTTGEIVRSAAAVPVNEVLPSIVGASVQVGVTLTALEGKFSGGPTSYAYQWQHDASGNGTFANVAVGGTAKTYVPVVGDIADFLRVGITPTNSAGAGSTVYSLPVGPIIAA